MWLRRVFFKANKMSQPLSTRTLKSLGVLMKLAHQLFDNLLQPYLSSGHYLYTKARYTLWMYIVIFLYAILTMCILSIGNHLMWSKIIGFGIYLFLSSLALPFFYKKKLLLSQYIMFISGIINSFFLFTYSPDFHYYTQIIFILFVVTIVHISFVQLTIMNFTLFVCVIARSIYLYTLTSNSDFLFEVFHESIFIGISIIALIVFSMAFNQIIKQDIFETDTLRNVIHIDVLTGLYNRYKFNIDIENLPTTSGLYQLAIIDIDHFKGINDSYGHDVGDEVIIELTRQLRSFFSPYPCSLYRWGGEEFVVLIPLQPTISSNQFCSLLERFRNQIMDFSFISQQQITISIGVSTIDSTYALFSHADSALYTAKQNGRNQLRTYESEV